MWTSDEKDAFLFYTVNRERYPVDLTFTVAGSVAVEKLSDGARVAMDKGLLRIALGPYELRTFKSRAGTRLERIEVRPPASEVARLKAQLDWLDVQSRDAVALRLSPTDRALLQSSSRQARDHFSNGQFWAARVLLEHHRLRALYHRLGGLPPLLDNATLSQR